MANTLYQKPAPRTILDNLPGRNQIKPLLRAVFLQHYNRLIAEQRYMITNSLEVARIVMHMVARRQGRVEKSGGAEGDWLYE